MYAIKRSLRFIRGAVLTYGPSFIKRSVWNKEYLTDKWNFNDSTTADCIYPYLENYSNNGTILDLGCGSGNTANELSLHSYTRYVGVDISDSALSKARSWTENNGRTAKNTFVRGDLLSYVPTQQFDVILFRESMYHVPLGKVKGVLDHYAQYLKPDGVIIVRMHAGDNNWKPKYRPTAMLRSIERQFDVLHKAESRIGRLGTILVFRPRQAA